jgi:hypothetical protein
VASSPLAALASRSAWEALRRSDVVLVSDPFREPIESGGCRLQKVDRRLNGTPRGLGPAPRAELLHVLVTSRSKVVQFLPQPHVLVLQPQIHTKQLLVPVAP